MRDIKRIGRILGLITKIWYKNPDLRLTQLIMNALAINSDPYFIEDEELEEALNKLDNNT
jgi:uncharacterized protein YihD (DUF1040 family)